MGRRNPSEQQLNMNTANVRNVESNHITLFSDDETPDMMLNIHMPDIPNHSENEFEDKPPPAKRAKKDNQGKNKNRKK